MSDEFSARYGELLTGSYDCVDRVVLNAYDPPGHNPGGFRTWWRRLHGGDEQGDERLDNVAKAPASVWDVRRPYHVPPDAARTVAALLTLRDRRSRSRASPHETRPKRCAPKTITSNGRSATKTHAHVTVRDPGLLLMRP